MMDTLLTFIAGILIIGILILVHEFGHFIVARKRGVKVEVFSIGFGPPILKKRIGETEYRLSLLFIGGYVKMYGDEIEEREKVLPGGFFSATPFTRILICVAGGFSNLLFAWLLYTGVYFTGQPLPEGYMNTVVGYVLPGSPASKADIRPGDRILSINGRIVKEWDEVVSSIAFSTGNKIRLVCKRGNNGYVKEIDITKDPKTGVRRLGILPEEIIIIARVLDGSPAQDAGIRGGDQLYAINAERIYSWKRVVDIVRESNNHRLLLELVRDGRKIRLGITPRKIAGIKYPIIGIIPTTRFVVVNISPWESFFKDLKNTYLTIRGLIRRSISVKALSGPVGIMNYIGMSLQVGLSALLSLMALISLNLGIINLLPVPVFDGGHILFNTIEWIIRRPISARVMENIQRVFLIIIIGLALYVTYNDLVRIIGG